MKLYDLKINNRKTPICIDRKRPVFSWKLSAEEKGVFQESYRIRVFRETGEEVWDSGKVASSQMTDICYEGEELLSEEHYCIEAECTARTGDGVLLTAQESSFFETGFFEAEEWKGCFIGEVKDHEYHLYRKSFALKQGIKKAKLYVCGMGHFEGYLNGKRVHEYVLEPGWSDYNKTCFYNAYDVTASAREGKNALLMKLGDGMFHVPGGRYAYYPRSYGKSKLLLQLVITYQSGEKELIVSDESWKMADSPVTFSCIYGGEDYDARRWKEEYLLPEYEEDAAWVKAVRVEPPKGRLTAMPMESMKVMKRYVPVSVKKLETGAWLYDFGTNFSGRIAMKLRTDGMMSGRKITLKVCELLNPDGGLREFMRGHEYAWNYILNEKEEQEFAPNFSYTGFRYLEMSGAVPTEYAKEGEKQFPVLEELLGEFIYPDLETAGEFSCSNQLFNDIHKIVLQAVLSNTKSYFTDCPHREKLGWLEQTHLIGPSVMYNLDVHNLYDKIEQDMKDAQRENGLVPDICPEYVTGFEAWHKGFVDSPEWGSACILNAWYVYKRYGDISLIERYYDVMQKYLEYLTGRTHHEVLHHGLGDWLDIGPCHPHSQNTPVPVVATCIYYYDLGIMRRMAFLLGKKEDAQKYEERMERVYEEYNLQFYDDQTGRYATGSQAAQAMSLIVGLVPETEEKKVIKQLHDDIVKRSFAITAGDIGHPFLIMALMKYGMSDLLNEMTNITETPGYGYQVVNGATTLTEDWDGPDPAGQHGSQNHFMLGSIEEWFYGSLGGMELVKNDLPFGRVRIVPHAERGIDWVKAWTMHPYGKIAVEWERRGDNVHVKTEIPVNVTASLETPDGELVREVGSGIHEYSFPAK